MAEVTLGMWDTVTVEGEQGSWRIVGLRDTEPRFQIQFAADAASQKWVPTARLKACQEA